MDLGISPMVVDGMSLYELGSTLGALEKRRKPSGVTDEEFAEGSEMLLQLAARDPSIRLH